MYRGQNEVPMAVRQGGAFECREIGRSGRLAEPGVVMGSQATIVFGRCHW